MSRSLAKMLDLLSEPAFLAGEKGEVVYLNEPFRQLVDCPPGRENERSLIELGLFHNHAEFRGFLRGFQRVGGLQRVQMPGQRLGDRHRDVHLSAVRLDNGELFGLVDLNRPPPAALPAAGPPDERLLLENLSFLVLVTDGAGRIQYANAAARDRLDLPDQPAPGGTAKDLAAIDAEFTPAAWRKHQERVRAEGFSSYETTFLLHSGRLLPVRVTLNQVYGIPVRRVELVARDITRERTQQQQLDAARLRIDELKHALERRERFMEQQRETITSPTIITANETYRRLLHQVERVARTESTVLITGESGTGKELIGRTIHAHSARADKPMITVNCGALPKDLIESELFGHRKGSFTGAHRDHVGRFELADKSTLFLDEIGELPLDLQTRLLRFLQEGEFTPVGATEPVFADVRVVSATNRDLPAMVTAGRFRADLFYRLNVFPVHNPPLRERPEDIPLLVQHFIDKHARRLNSLAERASPTFLDELSAYPFPGNIRELENIVQRALILSEGPTLEPPAHGAAVLPSVADDDPAQPSKDGEWPSLEELQRNYLIRVLRATNGKVSGLGGAAELLRINPQTLYTKIRKLGIGKSNR